MKRPNRGGLEVRCQILVEYAKWTARAAVNSGCPVKRTGEVYQLLDGVAFAEVFSGEPDFNAWHERETLELCERAAKLRPDVAPFPVGWSAKLTNVFLKTAAYAGGLGGDELRGALHPPLDAGLQQGLRRRFGKREYPEIYGKVTFGAIKDITTYKKYRTVIEGCRTAADVLGCSMIEVEQLAGIGLREGEDPPGRSADLARPGGRQHQELDFAGSPRTCLEVLGMVGWWTRTQCLRTSLDHLFSFELRDPPETPVYQKIAAEAAEMDAGGACIPLMARQFGVDPKTVMKAIAWFHVGRPGS